MNNNDSKEYIYNSNQEHICRRRIFVLWICVHRTLHFQTKTWDQIDSTILASRNSISYVGFTGHVHCIWSSFPRNISMWSEWETFVLWFLCVHPTLHYQTKANLEQIESAILIIRTLCSFWKNIDLMYCTKTHFSFFLNRHSATLTSLSRWVWSYSTLRTRYSRNECDCRDPSTQRCEQRCLWASRAMRKQSGSYADCYGSTSVCELQSGLWYVRQAIWTARVSCR